MIVTLLTLFCVISHLSVLVKPDEASKHVPSINEWLKLVSGASDQLNVSRSQTSEETISEIETLEELSDLRRRLLTDRITAEFDNIKQFIYQLNLTLTKHEGELKTLQQRFVVYENPHMNKVGNFGANTSARDETAVEKNNKPCTEHRLHCSFPKPRLRCFWKEYPCVGTPNCEDNEDTTSCPTTHTCNALEFPCHKSNRVVKCIPQQHVCDGEDDCGNNEDESNCSNLNRSACPYAEFACDKWNTSKCLPNYLACDDNNDCDKFEDEVGCFKDKCHFGYFPCPGTGNCIGSLSLCDRINNCGKNEDEERCTRVSSYCPLGLFTCSQSNRCISYRLVCDGNNDCGQREDEENCTNREDYFDCGPDESIRERLVCNGVVDCTNGADEKGCFKNSPVCNTTERFWCRGIDKCLHNSAVCDGYQDCDNGFDEEGCNGKWPDLLQLVKPGLPALKFNDISCRNDEFSCYGKTNMTYCISETLECNGEDDCGENQDEMICDDSSEISDTWNEESDEKAWDYFTTPREG